jgi:hypothetical protein
VSSRRLPRLLLAVCTLAVAMTVTTIGASTTSARADTRTPHVDAGTDPNGATVHVIDGSVTGESGGHGRTTNDGCVRRYVATTELVYKFPQARFDAPRDLAPAPSLFHQAFDVYCGDTYLTTVWAIPQAAAAALGAQFARELLARVEFPPVTIAASPRRGLTGLDSWFWIDGTDGSPITLTRSDLGITVDLEVRLVGVAWDFGDGAHLDAGLGKVFPARSDVTHVYETRGRHAVSATFRFTARYRIDGGDWIDLGPVPRTVDRVYDVTEVRGLLVR